MSIDRNRGVRRIVLIRGEARTEFPASLPHQNASFVTVQGTECEDCPEKSETLRVIGGKGWTSEDKRAIESHGCCLDCGKYLGTLRAEVDTLFGIDEDAAVMARCRVYSTAEYE